MPIWNVHGHIAARAAPHGATRLTWAEHPMNAIGREVLRDAAWVVEDRREACSAIGAANLFGRWFVRHPRTYERFSGTAPASVRTRPRTTKDLSVLVSY